MDTEELIRKCKALSIREEEKNRVTLEVKMKEKREKVLAGCLMGKILLPRGVHKEGFKIALQQVWRTIKEVKIESLGSNIFMFKFAEEVDKRRVMSRGSWHFDRALIVLTEPKGIGGGGGHKTVFYSHILLGADPQYTNYLYGTRLSPRTRWKNWNCKGG